MPQRETTHAKPKPEVTRPKPEVTRPKPEVTGKPKVLQDPLLREYTDASRRSRVGVGMNRSASEGKKCKAL